MTTPQIFFTHVMKTGGTSVSRALRSQFPIEATYPAADSTSDQIVAKTFSHLLLGLDADERARLRLFSVHQPAWVALAVAPDALKITVLREPVARTISHLRQISADMDEPADLEAVYAVEGYRSRLANYQTQLFADTHARNQADVKVDVDELDEAGRNAITDGLAKMWATGIARPLVIGPAEYATAAAVLGAYDCVGVTERLGEMVDRVAGLTGLDLPSAPHVNVGDRSAAVSPGLLDQITEDNAYDLQLYALACRSSDRPAPPI